MSKLSLVKDRIPTAADVEKQLSMQAKRKADLTSLPTTMAGREACNDCCCDAGCETFG